MMPRSSSPFCLLPEPEISPAVRHLAGLLAKSLAQHRLAPSKDSQQSLLAWGKRYLPDYFTAPPSKMHHWMATQLHSAHQQRGLKLNVIGPRGGAKSTVGTLAYALRVACEEWERYIWIISDTQAQAQLHLENIKTELTDNERLAKRYPQACNIGPRWRRTAIQLNNGVTIEAFGTGQRIRGRRYRTHRPTLIICDDLQNDRQISSPTQRQQAHRWLHGTLLPAGTDRTNVLNLATALHRHALAIELCNTSGWQSRIFPAILRWPVRTDLWKQWEDLYCQPQNPNAITDARLFYDRHRQDMDGGAELLWPEREGLYTLMCNRVESGRATFEREKQGSPIDPDACEWPESYFEEHIWFDQWPAEIPLRTMALDPSKGTDARQSDYSAFVMIGVTPQGELYIDADLARRPTPQMVSDGVALYQRFQPLLFGVEANLWQELLATEFLAEFRRQGILDRQLCQIRNHISKQTRIRRLGPYLSQRRMRFRRGSLSARMLVDQLRDFPTGTHDDGPDALEMALRIAEELWQERHVPNDGLGNRLKLPGLS